MNDIVKVDLRDKLELINEYWEPRIAGELNGQMVKLAKIKGTFEWHAHDEEDEFFMVIEGSFELQFRDRSIFLSEGEFIIVPKGVEHRPVAAKECSIMLFEPAGTLNTGNIESDKTKRDLKRI